MARNYRPGELGRYHLPLNINCDYSQLVESKIITPHPKKKPLSDPNQIMKTKMRAMKLQQGDYHQDRRRIIHLSIESPIRAKVGI